MILTVLNISFWKIDDATIQFVVADIALLISLYFVRRGLVAETKLRQLELHHMDVTNEERKEAMRAIKSKSNSHAQRVEQKRRGRRGGNGGGGSGGSNKHSSNGNNHHHGGGAAGKAQHYIQQPMKK